MTCSTHAGCDQAGTSFVSATTAPHKDAAASPLRFDDPAFIADLTGAHLIIFVCAVLLTNWRRSPEAGPWCASGPAMWVAPQVQAMCNCCATAVRTC
jgi:hypothetical protein